MDLKKKIAKALSQSLEDAFVRLEDDDGISGFVVSPRFQGLRSLDRQLLIDKVLEQAPDPLTPEERRRVLMIAALTPVEFDSVGAAIRVSRVRELPSGSVKVVLHGSRSDAEYVREAIGRSTGVQMTEPKPVPDAPGVLISFRVRGTEGQPFTRRKALRLLKSDPYIEVLPNA